MATLPPGVHAFWRGEGQVRVMPVDLRERSADVAGQEIMTADKVTLRLNALVAYRITDPVTARKAKATPGLSTTAFNQSVIQATWVNNKKKPLDDPRVRRAMHLVLDKPVLVEVVKDVTPMMVGGFIYPFSEFATPKE